ncbi:MAG: ABC transporter permease, partial [Terriglobales bacterium]
MPTAVATAARRKPKLVFGEIFSFAFDTFRSNKVRFLLTALGMMIGTASLILVATISLTGKQYVLNLIQGIGTNMVEAEYQAGGPNGEAAPDDLTIDDMHAAQMEIPGIAAASPVVPLYERISIGNGKERDIQVLGVDPAYLQVRNLVVIDGRFFDAQDSQAHNKVAVITLKLAEDLYGSCENALGKVVKLTGLPFSIIGCFRERVDTFGQSEVTDRTMLIPYSVSRYFQEKPSVRQIYFSATDASQVVPITNQIQRVIQSRHRATSVYRVQNLTQLLAVADKTANALTAILLAVSFVVLLVSGIGIMNIMLATVSARIREIGIRKAMGATNRE